MELTLAKLHSIMYHADNERLARFVGPLNYAMAEWEIDTPLRAAAFLAQLAHESGEFRYMEEIASGAAYDDRADLGNTKPEAKAIAKAHNSTPGRFWKGHGPIQITGYDNHLACGQALRLNLIDEPMLLSTPGPGCRSAAWFFRNAKLRDGTFVDLNPYADEGDIRAVSLAVNRGLLRSSHDPLGWHERQSYYDRGLKALGPQEGEI